MGKEEITINAVHENDLKKFMKNLGLWKDYKRGNLKCVCGRILDDNNLAAFKKIKGKVWGLCERCLISHS